MSGASAGNYDDEMMMMIDHQRFLGGGGGGPGGGNHPYYAVLFPTVAVIVGIFVHYILGRVLHHKFPYTAAMFLLGTLLGAAILPNLGNTDGQFYQSTKMWSNIDGHVLLLVFLPGVLFKDAFCMDVHLFKKAFGQCFTMAFPEVLAGMTLTACVLSYVFPYGSPFLYSMLLGSILAATDPVAVAALLNEVGAPPRLKTHIAGESLLNDGAAIVFFNIFYKMDLYVNTGGKYGETFTWGSGFLYFLKLSLGSMLLGTALGVVQVALLWLLKPSIQL